MFQNWFIGILLIQLQVIGSAIKPKTPQNTSKISNVCTKSLGFWKKNPAKVQPLTLGKVKYSKKFISDILAMPNEKHANQNALIMLAKQLAVARLNHINGQRCASTIRDISIADKLIGNKNVKKGYLDLKLVRNVLKRLQTCNQGYNFD